MNYPDEMKIMMDKQAAEARKKAEEHCTELQKRGQISSAEILKRAKAILGLQPDEGIGGA